MNQSEGMELINQIHIAAVRSRANAKEVLPKQYQGIAADLFPHTLGEASPLVMATQRIMDRGYLTSMDLYNIVTLANRDALIEAWCILNDVKLPAPHPSMMFLEDARYGAEEEEE